ncbi:cadherin repeat domain-containing protein [uncultured Croceitalea sp.]|uniref:cadherin repeat domain-containing protein n=1 Tax=uncultured Croceitalea sp. TaxID=1798908 RepID=UPI0033057427
MKRTIQTYLFWGILVVMTSCSTDDGETTTVEDTRIKIAYAENPVMGAPIDTISKRIQDARDFSLVLQSHKNAFHLDANTGILTVNDPLVFDYETNPLLTAIIEYQTSDGTKELEINVQLENNDDILHFLSTSQGIYELSSPGDWIMITKEEYETLENNLSEIDYCGTTKEQYDLVISGAPDLVHRGSFTVANDNGAEIPAGSYLFAFKYDIIPQVPKINIDDTQIKVSETSVAMGFNDLGGTLPTHSIGEIHFVLKGNETPLPTIGFLGMYKDTGVWTNSQFIGEVYYYGAGNVSNLDDTVVNQKSFKYQGLATTIKQWD